MITHCESTINNMELIECVQIVRKEYFRQFHEHLQYITYRTRVYRKVKYTTEFSITKIVYACFKLLSRCPFQDTLDSYFSRYDEYQKAEGIWYIRQKGTWYEFNTYEIARTVLLNLYLYSCPLTFAKVWLLNRTWINNLSRETDLEQMCQWVTRGYFHVSTVDKNHTCAEYYEHQELYTFYNNGNFYHIGNFYLYKLKRRFNLHTLRYVANKLTLTFPHLRNLSYFDVEYEQYMRSKQECKNLKGFILSPCNNEKNVWCNTNVSNNWSILLIIIRRYGETTDWKNWDPLIDFLIEYDSVNTIESQLGAQLLWLVCCQSDNADIQWVTNFIDKWVWKLKFCSYFFVPVLLKINTQYSHKIFREYFLLPTLFTEKN